MGRDPVFGNLGNQLLVVDVDDVSTSTYTCFLFWFQQPLHCQSEATQQTVVCISDFVDLKSLKREKFYPSVSGDESEWSQQGTLCRAGRIRSTAAHKVENEWETRDRWWVEQEWMKPGLPATCMCFDRLEDIISLHREKIQFNDRSDSLVRGKKLFTPESISLFTL